MEKTLTEKQITGYRARANAQRKKAQERDQKLREALYAKDADIEAVVHENGRPDSWAGIIKDILKVKKPNFALIADRRKVARNTVRWIAKVIGKSSGGRNNRRDGRAIQKRRKLARDVYAAHPDKNTRQIADILLDEHDLDVTPSWVASVKSGKYKRDRRVTSPSNKRAPLTLAQRKMALIYLQQTPRLPSGTIAKKIGLRNSEKGSLPAVNGLAHDNWLFVRSSRSLNVEMFLDAAEELLQQELSRSPYDVPAVVRKYIDILPEKDFRRIAVHYGCAQPDNPQAAFALKYLNRLSNAEVQQISAGYYYEKGSLRRLDQIASYVDNLPDEERQMVLDRRLRRPLSADKAEPIARKYIEKLPIREVQVMLTQRLHRPHDRAVHGAMQRIDGFRPWSQRRAFLDAAVSVYLEMAGITEPKELERQTDGHYVTLNMPAKVRLIVHFALAARGTYLNRTNVRSRDAKGDFAFAPRREELDTLALGIQRSRTQQPVQQAASMGLV